ncbi:MAG: drug resistance transporter, EmrB/QacA [Frankiales bacterium]|nr:drug resistance transporter, EmrB/QacA [Frankiales bacterium]
MTRTPLAGQSEAPTRRSVGLRSERGPILLALMLTIGLVAIDSTIIATAVPSVVDDLGGFAQFPWLFSAYLLTQAVTVPLYGKLADLFGRKAMILTGIGLFLLGSVLCAAAWSMTALIAFRAVQGLGAGAVQPVSVTIVGDLYTLEERAKVQGYLASVWGIAAVAGPGLGGVFSEYVSWRWIFIINIPLCALAAVMLWRAFTEPARLPGSPRIDYRGAALLTTGSALVILGVLEGGQSWEWQSVPGVTVPAVGVALLVGFVLVERHVEEPVLPLWVFRRRLLLAASAVSFAVGVIVLGLTSYLPTFVQEVLGTGPVVAGFALATLTIGWPVSAAFAGRIYLRYGVRTCALLGACAALVGTALLTLVDARSSVAQVAATCFVIGLGMGLVASPTLIAAQASVGYGERGVVTANGMFSRAVGSALGVAVFGAVANTTLGSAGTARAHTAAELTAATQHVFVGVLLAVAAMTVGVACLPGRPDS